MKKIRAATSCERERRAHAGRAEQAVERRATPISDIDAPSARQISASGSGGPADRRLADRAHPPGRREHPRDRAHPAGEQRQRHEEPADEPDRVLEQLRRAPTPCGSGRTSTASRNPSMPTATIVATTESAEEQRVDDVQRRSRTRAAPRAASTPCSRARSPRSRASSAAGSAQKCVGAADEQLERAVPALPLQRRAGRRRSSPSRRPSPPRRARRRRASCGSPPGPEHEERHGREEERPEDREQAVERRAAEDLERGTSQPTREQPGRPHASLTSAT